MALVLTYRNHVKATIDAEGVVPSAVRGKSLSEVERIAIKLGEQTVPLAELFAVAGSADDDRIDWQGDLTGVAHIGARMDGGEMRIEGHAGPHLGSEMAAGRIHVHGHASNWPGAQMRGGVLHISGSVGSGVGAAYDDSPLGMTGGSILIEGSGCHRVGHRMRRGLIAIGGVDDDAGAEMRGGTILVFGPCGRRMGAGMRGGTIALLGRGECQLLSGFRHACRFRPPFFPLLVRELRKLGYPVPEGAFSNDVEAFSGDLDAQGTGEVLLGVR